jgi:hypothetical protein
MVFRLKLQQQIVNTEKAEKEKLENSELKQVIVMQFAFILLNASF